jgi:hypothetical protein
VFTFGFSGAFMFKKRTPKLRRALEMVGYEVVYANAPIPHISKENDILSTLGKRYTAMLLLRLLCGCCVAAVFTFDIVFIVVVLHRVNNASGGRAHRPLNHRPRMWRLNPRILNPHYRPLMPH